MTVIDRSWRSVLGLFLCACGGAEATAPEQVAPAATSGEEKPPPRRSGMQVEGILGTIPQRKIEERLQARLPDFQRCFFDGLAEVEQLSGYMKFYFRVGLDGQVEYVSPRGSNIGHRPTEQCLLTKAAKVQFPEPKGGGPAEFAWGFEIENQGGVRAPVDWPEDRVSKQIADQRAGLDQCQLETARYVVTAYVAPGGTVVAAGAAADSQPAAAKIDCVVAQVKTWRMPDPGSYPAKVSFRL